MAGQQEKKAKGSPKLSNDRNKKRSAAWWATDRFEVNRFKRVLPSNGPEAALRRADKNGSFGALRKLKKLKPGAYARAVAKSETFRKFDQGK